MLTPPQPEDGAHGPGGWHQNNGRRTVDMHKLEIPAGLSVKVGYFLSDVSRPDMGNFWVIPGSHRLRGVEVRAGEGGMRSGADPILAQHGDAMVFDGRLWHSVSANYSDVTRKMLFFGYAYRWLRSEMARRTGTTASARRTRSVSNCWTRSRRPRRGTL